jgi:CBS domain-containing protein
MKCGEIMKTNVHCVTTDNSVQEAARIMREQNVGFLPVCGSAKEVVGTITDRDITVRLTAEARSPKTTKVEEIMSKDVVSCRPEQDLQECERAMAQFQKSRVVVVNDERKLQGVISLSDIADRDRGNAADTLRKVAAREAHA